MGFKESFKAGWIYALLSIIIYYLTSLLLWSIIPRLASFQRLSLMLYIISVAPQYVSGFLLLLILSLSKGFSYMSSILILVYLSFFIILFLILSWVLGRTRKYLEQKIASGIWKKIANLLIGLLILLVVSLVLSPLASLFPLFE